MRSAGPADGGCQSGFPSGAALQSLQTAFQADADGETSPLGSPLAETWGCFDEKMHPVMGMTPSLLEK